MIQIYAMLDNCSQGSFIYENLVKEIGVRGMKTNLNLKTLHGERTENTMVVEGTKVAGMNDDSSWLALPKLYARKEIPVDKEEIVTPANITEWQGHDIMLIFLGGSPFLNTHLGRFTQERLICRLKDIGTLFHQIVQATKLGS